jgi:pimeloyl-ACP methyl ester carboxylesterase
MIPPRHSRLIAGLLPHATAKIYPDAAHGFLFQHHAELAADVTEFPGLKGETRDRSIIKAFD